jgi:hypothetical protein
MQVNILLFLYDIKTNIQCIYTDDFRKRKGFAYIRGFHFSFMDITTVCTFIINYFVVVFVFQE